MSRLILSRLLALPTVLIPAMMFAAEPAPQRSPVEGLRQALVVPVANPLDKADLEFRRVRLTKRVQALAGADLGPALRLQEWRDEDRDDAVAAIDKAIRESVLKRFTTYLRDALRMGAVTDRRAALTLLGESGFIRVGGKGPTVGSTLAADAIPLLKHQDESLCRSAARALGRILPPPKESAAALGELLSADDVARRRAAAEGLASWSQTIAEGSGRPSDANAPPSDLVRAAAAVVPVAGRGTADADPQVRRLSLEVIRRAGTLLNDLVLDLEDWQQLQRQQRQGDQTDFSLVPDRKPGPAELAQIEAYVKAVKEERAMLAPLEQVLAAAMANVGRSLANPDAAISRAACEALEAIPPGRRRLVSKAATITAFAKDPPAEDPLGPELRKLVPALAALTSDKEVTVRLAALYALEELEEDAAQAVDALIKALQDTDPFVRWAAVRVLGKMAPKAAAAAVPGLASVLADENGDVRVTAAAALERYGREAKAAVPALAKAAGGDEAEMSLLAIRALSAIGPEAAPAVPALAKALSAPAATVRVQAAQVLGRLGAAARPAADALKKALDDSDADVRRTAAEALLAIR